MASYSIGMYHSLLVVVVVIVVAILIVIVVYRHDAINGLPAAQKSTAYEKVHYLINLMRRDSFL